MRKAASVAAVAATAATVAGLLVSGPAAHADSVVALRNGADPNLVAAAVSPEPGTPAVLAPWEDGPGQRWLAERTPRGVQFRNIDSGLCLAVAGASREPGAAVNQEPCDGSASRIWGVHDAGDGRAFVTNVHSGKCLVPTGVGEVLRQDDCQDRDAGTWVASPE